MKLKMLIAGILLNTSALAHADIVCQGKVLGVVVLAEGHLNVHWGFDWIYLCNIHTSIASPTTVIPKESCSAWFAQAMTAIGSNKDFATYHVGLNTCSGLRASSGWSVVQPVQAYVLNY